MLLGVQPRVWARSRRKLILSKTKDFILAQIPYDETRLPPNRISLEDIFLGNPGAVPRLVSPGASGVSGTGSLIISNAMRLLNVAYAV